MDLIPQSTEAEQAVLGGLMLVPAALDKIKLTEPDFFLESHRVIYRAMRELWSDKQHPDAVTLGEWLENKGLDKSVGGSGYVASLVNGTPGASNLPAYARIVAEKAQLRRLLDVSRQISEGVYGGDSCGELIEQATKNLLEFRKPNQRHSVSIREALKQAMVEIEHAEERRNAGGLVGVSTGLSRLDSFTGGWQKQDLIVIGARPSVGKTALICGFAINAGVPVGFASAEQGASQIAMRHVAQRAKIPLQAMRRGEMTDQDYQKLQRLGPMSDLPYWIWDRPAPTIDEVVAQARQWKHDHDIKLFLVDYIQRLRAPGHQSRAYEVNEICQRLKELARELDIPVIALAQVNRSVDAKGADYIPQMGDLSDSSGIEKEADVVIILHRPDVIDPEHKHRGTATLAIQKHRSGPTGYCRVAFVGQFLTFEDLAVQQQIAEDYGT